MVKAVPRIKSNGVAAKGSMHQRNKICSTSCARS
jgi:hypothetical protein